ncbi:MAG: hypothetical protein HQ478_09530 [Chloroflexi bacterium]|nr:hypothetical protein [Chloroflexota bacterium]
MPESVSHHARTGLSSGGDSVATIKFSELSRLPFFVLVTAVLLFMTALSLAACGGELDELVVEGNEAAFGDDADVEQEIFQDGAARAYSGVQFGDLTNDEYLGTIEALKAVRDADEIKAIRTAEVAEGAGATREAQDELIEVFDTALAGDGITRGRFIDAVETITAGGNPDINDFKTPQAETPPEPEPELLPTEGEDREPDAVKAKEYLVVGVHTADPWTIGDPYALSGRSGASGSISLGAIDMFWAESAQNRGYEWNFEFSFGSPYRDQTPGRTITLRGKGTVTGGGAIPTDFEVPTMYFHTDLPDENITLTQEKGPIEIGPDTANMRSAIVEAKILIPEGNVGDQFTMGWGLTGCPEPCNYFWTFEGKE